MWLITTFDFFRVVQKPGDDIFIVRTRTRQDLGRVKTKYIPELGEIIQGTDEDYKYVAGGPHDAVARAVGEIAMTIDYRDLRESVHPSRVSACDALRKDMEYPMEVTGGGTMVRHSVDSTVD